MRVNRGDIVIVDLDPTKGSEQSGVRPCLVVQNDIGNRNSPNTIVAIITSSFSDDLYPFEVLIEAKESGLKQDSVVDCSNIRTVSIDHRIKENLGRIPNKKIDKVNTALKYSLGITKL